MGGGNKRSGKEKTREKTESSEKNSDEEIFPLPEETGNSKKSSKQEKRKVSNKRKSTLPRKKGKGVRSKVIKLYEESSGSMILKR